MLYLACPVQNACQMMYIARGQTPTPPIESNEETHEAFLDPWKHAAVPVPEFVSVLKPA